MTATTPKEVILTIRNHHIAECGAPPSLNEGAGQFLCYFVNQHGEQCIMQYDSTAKVCRLWMGDVGWEEELAVEEFRGKVLVRFTRTREERRSEFKMNKQFDHGLPPIDPEQQA
jgi:hypothetical protein